MFITLAIIAAIALYVVFIYNGLVKARQMKEEAWSGIDVQLKRRADLIPNLIETVKGYAAHEKSTFEEVIAMRNRAQAVPAGDVEGRAQAEGLLSQALGKLFALAEAYPDLKANTNFLELQRSLETIEGELQMSRRYYNGAARDLNVKVESFPSNLVAGQFGFSKAPYFEIENPADRAVPTVKF
ncbi:LemA family protein [Agrobacterium radiobacter]|jgi:LemA protein|uniref:Protein LemA n=2 Tax=Agrobacterium tumefaciens complex TaxID=1183400 RepID=A0A822V1L8_AGRTU|nr:MULTISPECIES: LemA family protein [Agrobacterium tumefaciens complex]MCP2135667.1 LemA protein [Rhizobium sp. SLBN-94]TGE81987.1 LemA family protein [Rhizobium sp. SEMIA 439]HBT69915.1 LemA family protein [Agrobacterium sp.]AYM04513.1 membrane protein [Agrobacterium tumefaciens]EPR07206.1 membrane protein [Agrobacterium radiobacter DSM 30147]